METAKEELRAEGIAFNEDIQIGIMVEIPAVAAAAELFTPHVDFSVSAPMIYASTP